jgi:hypothetical protein
MRNGQQVHTSKVAGRQSGWGLRLAVNNITVDSSGN